MSATLTIKGGTLIHINGLPACLAGDTAVETENFDALRPFSTTPYEEYPKMLPDGRIVQSATDEAKALADPLAAVTIEMDNPAFQAGESPEARQRLAEASAALARGEEPKDTRTAAEKKADKKAAAQ